MNLNKQTSISLYKFLLKHFSSSISCDEILNSLALKIRYKVSLKRFSMPYTVFKYLFIVIFKKTQIIFMINVFFLFDQNLED